MFSRGANVLQWGRGVWTRDAGSAGHPVEGNTWQRTQKSNEPRIQRLHCTSSKLRSSALQDTATEMKRRPAHGSLWDGGLLSRMCNHHQAHLSLEGQTHSTKAAKQWRVKAWRHSSATGKCKLKLSEAPLGDSAAVPRRDTSAVSPAAPLVSPYVPEWNDLSERTAFRGLIPAWSISRESAEPKMPGTQWEEKVGTSMMKSGQHQGSHPDAHGLERASRNAAGGWAGRRAYMLGGTRKPGPWTPEPGGDGGLDCEVCTWLQRCTRVSALTWLYLEDCIVLSINYSSKLMCEKYIKIGIILFITHKIVSPHI